jgi:hypothetical protein
VRDALLTCSQIWKWGAVACRFWGGFCMYKELVPYNASWVLHSHHSIQQLLPPPASWWWLLRSLGVELCGREEEQRKQSRRQTENQHNHMIYLGCARITCVSCLLCFLTTLWDPWGLFFIPWFSHLCEIFCTLVVGNSFPSYPLSEIYCTPAVGKSYLHLVFTGPVY